MAPSLYHFLKRWKVSWAFPSLWLTCIVNRVYVVREGQTWVASLGFPIWVFHTKGKGRTMVSKKVMGVYVLFSERSGVCLSWGLRCMVWFLGRIDMWELRNWQWITSYDALWDVIRVRQYLDIARPRRRRFETASEPRLLTSKQSSSQSRHLSKGRESRLSREIDARKSSAAVGWLHAGHQ